MNTRTLILLPRVGFARPHSVKCYRPGCRKRKHGYLPVNDKTGQLYDRMGRKLADLREQDYACSEHGIANGSTPFLYRDTK